MAITTAIKTVGSIIGGSKQKKASKKAIAAQKEAVAEGRGYLTDYLNQSKAAIQPYSNAGLQALPQYMAAITDPNFDINRFRNTPGYQFAQEEGREAVEQSGAARGMMMSGGNLKDLMRYSQGLADQTYGNYVNRLRDATNMGFTGSKTLGDYLMRTGENQTDLSIGLGDARAAGYRERGDITAGQWNTGAQGLASIVGAFTGGGGMPMSGWG